MRVIDLWWRRRISGIDERGGLYFDDQKPSKNKITAPRTTRHEACLMRMYVLHFVFFHPFGEASSRVIDHYRQSLQTTVLLPSLPLVLILRKAAGYNGGRHGYRCVVVNSSSCLFVLFLIGRRWVTLLSVVSRFAETSTYLVDGESAGRKIDGRILNEVETAGTHLISLLLFMFLIFRFRDQIMILTVESSLAKEQITLTHVHIHSYVPSSISRYLF